MSRTHLITATPEVPNAAVSRVISPNTFDISDYIADLPSLDLQAHMSRGLVNNLDYTIKSAVYAAYRFLKQEQLLMNFDSAIEIANAVKELELSELSFFEAGLDKPSMLETVQQLTLLREHWIKRAVEASALMDAERSVAADLWAQANARSYAPLSIEEQLENPVFRTSKTTEHKIAIANARIGKSLGLSDEEITARTAAHLNEVEAQNLRSEEGLAKFAPVYIALYEHMLRADVSVMRDTEVRGKGYSTEGSPSRVVHTADNSFVALPYNVRAMFINRAIQDAETFAGWKMKDSRTSIDDYTLIAMLTERIKKDLTNIVRSPAYTQAARVTEAA